MLGKTSVSGLNILIKMQLLFKPMMLLDFIKLMLGQQYWLTILFFFLWILLYVLFKVKYQRNMRVRNGKDMDGFLYIDSFRINNNIQLVIIIIKVFLYIFFNILFIIYIRYLRLGNLSDITCINLLDFFTLSTIIFFLSFSLFLYSYYQFTNAIIFPEIVKLYLYFFKKIQTKMFEFYAQHFSTGFISSLSLILAYTIEPSIKRDADESEKEMDDLAKTFSHAYELRTMIRRLKYKLGVIVYHCSQKFGILLYFVKLLHKILNNIRPFSAVFFKESCIVILFITLLYDINNQELYFIYYALFIYTIILLRRRFYQFIWATDLIGDKDVALYDLLYEGKYFKDMMYSLDSIIKMNEIDIMKLSDEGKQEYDARRIMQRKQAVMSDRLEDFILYLIFNLKNETVFMEGDPLDTPSRVWPIRRLFLLLSSVFCTYYLCFVRDIEILILGYSIANIFKYISLLLFLGYVINLWYTTGYVLEEKYGKIRQHYTYIIITLLFCFCTFYIFIKTKFTLISDEVLFNFGVTIIDHYSLQEKFSYFYTYLDYKTKSLNLSEDTLRVLGIYLGTIDLIEKITINSSLENIRDFISESIILSYYLDNIYQAFLDTELFGILWSPFPVAITFVKHSIMIFTIKNMIMSVITGYKILIVTKNLIYNYYGTAFKIFKTISDIF